MRRVWMCALGAAAGLVLLTGTIYGAEPGNQEIPEETVESYLAELDFSDIDKILGEQESTKELHFRELVERLIAGEEIDKGWLIQEVCRMVFGEITAFRKTLVQIVLLSLSLVIITPLLHAAVGAFDEILFYSSGCVGRGVGGDDGISEGADPNLYHEHGIFRSDHHGGRIL